MSVSSQRRQGTVSFMVTDELLAVTDHHALRDGMGRVLGVVGWDDLVGWFAAVAAGRGGWQTLDRSGSEVQARQRVHAVVGGGRWVPVDTEAGEW
jgi:hypothetical protein